MSAVVLLSACADARAEAISDPDVVIVSGPLTLESVPVARSVSHLEFRPGGPPAWIDASRIVLPDKDAAQAVVLDLRRGERARLGRRGMGPGEMLLPMWIVARPDGSMVVGDGMGMSVTEFSAAGRVGRVAHFPGRPLGVTGWVGDIVTGAWIDGSEPVVGAVDLSTDEAVDHFRPYATPEVAASAQSPLGRSFFLMVANGGGDRVLLGGGMTYEVFSFDRSGRRGHTFRRPELPAERMTDEEFSEHSENLTRVLRAGGRQMMAHRDEVLRMARDNPKPFFRSGGMSVDEQGRVWVVTSHRTARGTAVDVFSPDGSFLARLDVPGKVGSVVPRLPYVAVSREGIGGDVDGYDGVDVYRVRD